MKTLEALPNEDEIVLPKSWKRYLFPRRGEATKSSKPSTPAAAQKIILKAFEDMAYKQFPEAKALLQKTELDNTELELVGQALAKLYNPRKAQSAWGDWAIQQMGLISTLRFAIAAEQGDNFQSRRNSGLLLTLRQHLGELDEGAYQEALQEASSGFFSHHRSAVKLSFLFPDKREWREALLPALNYASAPWLLVDVDTVETAKPILRHLHLHSFTQDWCSNLYPQFLSNLGLEAGPLLADLAQRIYLDADGGKKLAKALACIPCHQAFRALLRVAESQKSATESLILASEQFPKLALQCLTTLQTKPNLVAKILKKYPDLMDTIDLKTEQKAYVEKLTSKRSDEVEAAPQGSWPECLRKPRWQERKKLSLPQQVLTTLPHDPKMSWAEGEREKWTSGTRPMEGDCSLEDFYQGVQPWRRQMHHAFQQLLVCPPTAAVELMKKCIELNSFDPWYFQDHAKGVIARWELRALPLLRAVTASKLSDSIGYAAPYDDVELCLRAAEAYSRLKSCRKVAFAYLDRYPETAAKALIPEILGKKKKQREWAKTALLGLNRSGHGQVLQAVAKHYGPSVEQALAPLYELDELDLLPPKIPELPGWLEVDALQKPMLKIGGALTDQALENFLTMLAISKPGEVYAGVPLVAEVCESKSLSDFAWSVFQAWLEAGADSKHYWALHTLGWLGTDDTVRVLTPMLKKWPGEGAHARAVQGLEVLTAIGTDIALMHLFGLSQKLKFKGLKNQAQERVAEIAENRGLTRDELGDRLVPDLGLEPNGSLTLDYGSRKFFVLFDEKLKPLVKDELGKTRKTLPKPGKTDETTTAEASFARFKSLKKDARTVASQQLVRLEMGMVKQRRWAISDFQRFFLQHPLVVHISRRLIWGLYLEGGLQSLFRIAEDGTLGDSEDEEWTLPSQGLVGIAHPFDLTTEMKSAWSEVLADYKILQPFAQLSREVFQLTEEEKEQTSLIPIKNENFESFRILSLESRGWTKGEALDGGVVCWMKKELGDGLTAFLDMEPGLVIGDPTAFPEQTLNRVTVHRGERGWDAKGGLELGAISKAMMSEVLRDLQALSV